MYNLRSLLAIFIISVTCYHSESYNSPSTCSEFQWQCDSGDCIQTEFRCDGDIHCLDGSDEIAENCIHMPCPKFAFRCAYGACITGKKRCDGRYDCADSSDETEFLCGGKENYVEINEYLRGTCSRLSAQIQCKSGGCISDDRRCDGFADCADGSDETVELCSYLYCPPYAFQCGYGGCIRGSAKCDGIRDCVDGSDEAAELCGYQRKHLKKKPPLIPHTPQYTTPHTPTLTNTTYLHPVQSKGCDIPSDNRQLLFEDDSTQDTLYAGTNVPYGTIVSFRCANKWQMVGENVSVCLRERWSHSFPTCNKYCPYATLKRGISTTAECFYNDNAINCSEPLGIGTKAYISCAPGYRLSTAAKETVPRNLTCDDDAQWDYSKFRCNPKCGVSSNDNLATVQPWDVSIFARSIAPIFKHSCSGTIISVKMVLTVASCFINKELGYPVDPVYFNVVEGHYVNSYRQGERIDPTTHNISQVLFPETIYEDSTLPHNIAIVALVNHFLFAKNIKPICLQFPKYVDINTVPYEVIKAGKMSVGVGQSIIYKPADRDRYFMSDIVAKTFEDDRIGLINIKYYKRFINRQINRYTILL